MLRIVINSKYKSAGTKVCIDDLVPRLKDFGHQVSVNKWERYDKYDLALFMSPDPQIDKAKFENPDICTGIMNPMIDYKQLRENARKADFIVVGSIEQRDAMIQYNKNIFIYFMFPEVGEQHKQHENKQKIIIGYHGNKEHLLNFYPHITGALERLGKEKELELWAVYNVSKLGQWKWNLPKNIKIRHIQWHEKVYEQEMVNMDIGLVNNIITTSKGWRHYFTQPGARYFNLQTNIHRQMDVVLRFKYSTNPGRLYPFAMYSVPVVVDFAPSMCQIVTDGETGLIANSEEGWFDAINKLINDKDLRQYLSDNLKKRIKTKWSIDKSFTRMNEYFIEVCR